MIKNTMYDQIKKELTQEQIKEIEENFLERQFMILANSEIYSRPKGRTPTLDELDGGLEYPKSKYLRY